ncbi:MAG: hypothetical protein PHD76_01830 [Methylacidiphilales bacterium]|nr:hypothetical protein [Candidatus Methylacidiphilales bacterium]
MNLPKNRFLGITLDKATVVMLLLLTLAWGLVRIYPLSRAVPWSFWEIWEAGKLLDYGFWNRMGALVDWHYSTGFLNEPYRFNYANHPYPILWFCTAIYYMAGGWGVVGFIFLFNLASCLLAFHVIRRYVSLPAATSASLLMVLAPSTIFFSINSNIIALGSMLWPWWMEAWHRARDRYALCGSAVGFWLLGGVVLAAGQISWLTYSMVPAFMVIILFQSQNSSKAPLEKSAYYALWAVAAGCLLSGLIFVAQIAYYTPDWSLLLGYAQGQAGLALSEVSPARMVASIMIKVVTLVGPALLLGVLPALWLQVRFRIRLQDTAWIWLYLGCWIVMALVLLRFFYRERSMYGYLIFPLVFLWAQVLERIRGDFWRYGVLLLALPGIFYVQLQSAIPVVSKTSLLLGGLVRRVADPKDLVLSNFRDQIFPFEGWDVGGRIYAAMAADRLFFTEIQTSDDVSRITARFGAHMPHMIYIFDPEQPIDEKLYKKIQLSGQSEHVTLEVGRESGGFAGQLRTFYWRLLNRKTPDAVTGAFEEARKLDIQLYSLRQENQP